ncbi:MAG: MFS transporter [Nitrospirota bacterium]|nr:MFS transporter [Nitrospirota bacterium]
MRIGLGGQPRNLAGFYLGYFGLIGVILPYLTLYLKDLGLTPYEIGIIMAINPMVKTVAPGIWGRLADHHGTRRPFLRGAGIGALVTFAAMLLVRDFWGIVLVMVLYSICTSSILPLVEATAMEMVDRLKIDYGKVRMWGSVGFIAASLGMGPVLDQTGSRVVLWAVLAFLAFNLWSMWLLPDSEAKPEGAPTGGLWALLSTPHVLAFYAVCMLMQGSHGTLYGFYSVWLEDLGYSRGTIGLLWAVAVGAEVTALMYSGPILSRFGTRRLMIAALALTVLRWGILAVTHQLGWLIAAQLLHAATFGLFHVAAVTHTHRMVPEHLRATGQSLYSSLSFGAGLTVGMYLSGTWYESLGAPALFAANAAVAVIALGLALVAARRPAETAATSR